jgi:hypothetical protein
MAQDQNKSTPKKNAKQSGEGKKKGGDSVKPKTPKKRDSKVMAQDSGDGEEGSPATPSKTGSASKRIKVKKQEIPASRAELSGGDRLMVDMKEAGKSWADINTAYTNLTGVAVGGSTLRNRYLKIKDSLAEWKDGDVSLFP